MLLGGLVLLLAKFWAWWLTNSNAILTDALESIINVVAGGFALFSLWLSAQPRDENHPYGHGKIEFLAAGFEGALILLAGLLILYKSVYNLVHPQPLQQLDLGILLVAISGLANFFLGSWLKREGKKVTRSFWWPTAPTCNRMPGLPSGCWSVWGYYTSPVGRGWIASPP